MAVSAEGRIRVLGEVRTRGFADAKAKLDLLIATARGLSQAFDKVFVEGQKFANLQRNLALDISQAEQATSGLVDRMTLMEAANRSAALGLGLSAKEFANVSKAAAIMSQKLGTDTKGAINDIITGMGRQSSAILDNLGIIVKANDAYTQYAQSVGKAVSELTSAERRTAFQTAAMKALNEKVGESKLQTDGAGNSWQRLKNSISNATDAIGSTISKSKALDDTFNTVSNTLAKVAAGFDFWLTGTSPRIEKLRKSISDMDADLVRILDKMGASAGELSSTFGLSAFAKGIGERPIKKISQAAGESITERVPQRRGGGRIRPRGLAAEGFFETFGGETLAGEAERQARIQATIQNIEADRQWADVIDMRTQKELIAISAAESLIQKQDQLARITQNSNLSMQEMATGGLAQWTAGIWSATEAAIVSGQSFGMAMAQMTKSILMGIAKQSTIKAIFYLAEGIAASASLNFASASAFFAAAAKHTAVAAVAGGAGLAISAGVSAGGGGGGVARAGSAGGPRGSFSTKEKRQKQTIVVEVYMGDRNDPSAALFDRRRLEARLSEAADA